jgi:ubiquinone/menaquinone biosynthesis C-methylase UbiE
MKKGMVYGIDYSRESVSISRKVNAENIKTGRVIIQSGTVSAMPFDDDFFDLVTAVETHYFWPDLSSDLAEALRVLKPSGVLVIIGGEYKGGKYDERNAPWVVYGNMTYLTLDELSDVLKQVGFVDVTIHEEVEKGWLCAVGEKP